MKKKIIFLLFILCLIKLYHIADRSLNFSTKLLMNSFKPYAGEESSLLNSGTDVIPIRNFFLSNNISEFKLSEEIIKNHEMYYQRIIEFSYPIKIKKNATILVAHKIGDEHSNCNLIELEYCFSFLLK